MKRYEVYDVIWFGALTGAGVVLTLVLLGMALTDAWWAPLPPTLLLFLRFLRALHRYRATTPMTQQEVTQGAARGAVDRAMRSMGRDPELHRAFARVAGSAGVPLLIESLRSKDPLARLGAAYQLGTRGEGAAAAVPALIESLSDTSGGVCVEAANALGKIGAAAKPAMPRLEELLAHHNEHVRKAATDALTKLRSVQ